MSELLIPSRYKGASHDTVSMYCADSVESARTKFEILRQRLLSINQWNSLGEEVKAEFKLFDGESFALTEHPKIGAYVRIAIPGMGNVSGNGYDWTKITALEFSSGESTSGFLSLTLKPCPVPNGDNTITAHFYTSDSTNTLMVRRTGQCLYAEVHGRNEVENTSGVPPFDALRNKLVAKGGILGIGSLHWQRFTNALLEPINDDA